MSSDPQEEYTEFLDKLHRPNLEEWSIRDDTAADYALRKIAQAEAKQRRDAACFATEVERLKAWLVGENARTQRTIDFYTNHLRRYAEELQAQGLITERQKSYKRPHGSIGYRATPATYRRDDGALVSWLAQRSPALKDLLEACQRIATEQPLVRITVEPNWAALKSRLEVMASADESSALGERYVVIDTETGEVVEGVTVESPPHDAFVVKANTD